MATKMTREEAINKVRQMCLPKETMEILQALAPELAESEDERIRKELKEAFEAYDIESTWNGIPIRSIFAWLEKQKEQKQEKFPPYVTGFKGDPDPAGTSDLEEAAKEYASKTLCDPDDGPSTGLAKESFIAGAEWQKEQKPASISRGHEIVKPAEWSEEDEDILNCCISSIEEAKENRYAYKETDGDTSYDREIAWLKSLSLNLKKKNEDVAKLCSNEWSEEDEKDMAHIIRILDDCYVYGTHDLSKTDHENLVNKLKSLRPSWKPSEEQMKALYDACCISFEEERDFHPSLSRLYHDLMKL